MDAIRNANRQENNNMQALYDEVLHAGDQITADKWRERMLRSAAPGVRYKLRDPENGIWYLTCKRQC